MAEAFMQLPEADEEPDFRPAMSEDGTVAVALRDIGNQLRLLRSESIAVARNGAAPKIPMLEGPKTILEKAAFTRRQRDHYALTARLLPHKAAEMQAKIEQLQ
jgi:hypothetical protein